MDRKLFDELLAKREQREADKLRVGVLSIPGGPTLPAKMPGDKVILELFSELAAADGPAAALACGNHAIYACCPALQERELWETVGTEDDPMGVVPALFSVAEQDQLGGQALQFLGLLPGGEAAKPEETVKNGSPATLS